MIIYEWVFEEMDGEDIEDCQYWDKLNKSQYLPTEVDTKHLCLALCRRSLDRYGDELDRAYAYTILQDDKLILPCNCDAFKIPQKYLKELDRWSKPIQDADKMMLDPKFRMKFNRVNKLHKVEIITKVKQLIMQSDAFKVIGDKKYINVTTLNDIFEVVETCDLDWD